MNLILFTDSNCTIHVYLVVMLLKAVLNLRTYCVGANVLIFCANIVSPIEAVPNRQPINAF